jgi:peroxiredoxin
MKSWRPKVKLHISKANLKIAVAMFLGIAAGLAAYPYARRAVKYFSLAGYSRLDDYKRRPVDSGQIPNFTLLDAEGNGHELYRQKDARALVFISHSADCKGCERYGYVVSGLKKEYETRNVRFFYLNSNSNESREQILNSSRKYPVRVPFLMDPTQVASAALQMTQIPEAVLIDPRNWSVIYRGPIDDQIITGASPTPAAFLRNSLEEFLHDKPISYKPVTWYSRSIAYKKFEAPPTYVKDAGPILAARCLYCHADAVGIRPYFTNYKVTKGWAAMIRETLLTRRMPPWTWDIGVAQPYLHTERLVLKTEEMQTLVAWIDAGAPRGDGKDPLLWTTRAWERKRYNLPKPDLLLSNREISVPPKGFNEYKFYEIAGPMKEDMWVIGTRLDSTNIKTVHHQMLIVTSKPLEYYTKAAAQRRDEELVEEDHDGGIPAWELHQMRMNNVSNESFVRIQVYGLGLNQPTLLRNIWKNNLGFFVPKGSHIVLETHYHGTGKPEKEISTVGLYLHKGPEKLKSINSGRVSFINHIELAPGAKSTIIDADPIILPKKSGLLALGLHMHMRGKSAKYFATYPDGKVELLASHPIFNYTTSTARGIVFDSSKILPAGTQVHIQCTFDNSSSNPFNPDPLKHVGWGQTIDRSEMCMGYLWTYDASDGQAEKILAEEKRNTFNY